MADKFTGAKTLYSEDEGPAVIDLDGESYEVINIIDFEDKQYAALTKYTEEDELEDDELEFIILEIMDDEDEKLCVLKTVDDDELYSRLGDAFMEVFEQEDSEMAELLGEDEDGE